ncbi:hypothetical protein FOL47_003130 [Perkinsus chesapeaki]|uniref:Peptidase A2 domain-containing protein n=1 Tax=Perkinsus chesapeaki TaxID=330153 RepID=A0A7J6KN68_PERCH|nr:hypothetical protein FOL47_003130 [Perkinsus chesapeaki]
MRPSYRKIATTVYPHVRDVNQLAENLILWEVHQAAGPSGVTTGKDGVKAVNDMESGTIQSSSGFNPNEADSATSGTSGPAPSTGDDNSGPQGVRGRKPIKCWTCGGPHLRRNCPLGRSASGSTTQPGQHSTDDASVPKNNFELVDVLVDEEDCVRQLKMGDPLFQLILREKGDCGARVECLLDTGARGCGYMSRNLYENLKSVKVITDNLNPCSGVRFGNNLPCGADGEITLTVDGYGELPFKVLPALEPDVILGLSAMARCPGLRQLLLGYLADMPNLLTFQMIRPDDCRVIDCSSDALFVTQTEDGCFEVHCPAFERGHILPYVEAPRRRSLWKAELINRWITAASKDGRWSEISPDQAVFISEVVLVCKDPSIGIQNPSGLTDDQIRKQYRVTLDCRRVNSLKLYEQSTGE